MRDWNQPSGNASHSARAPFDIDSLGLKPSCVARVEGHIISTPIAVDGMIFLYWADGKTILLSGICLETGSEVWRQDVEMHTGGYTTAGVVYGSRLYCHDERGVAARDIYTGQELARVPNNEERYGTCPSSSDGRKLYFHENTGALRAVDIETLESVWVVERRGWVSYMPPAIRRDLVVAIWITARKTHIACLDAESGEYAWQVDLLDAKKGMGFCSIDDMFVYFPFFPAGHVAAFNFETGREAWRYQAKRWPERSFDHYAGLCLAGDRLLHLIAPDACEALDPASGKLLWRSEIASPCNGFPIAGNSSAIVATNSGTIHRMDLDDGKHTGTCTIGEEISLPPSFSAAGPIVVSKSGLWLIS